MQRCGEQCHRGGAMIDCDFDNADLTCPRCGFNVGKIGGDASWRMNCPLGAGSPAPGTHLHLLISELGGKPTSGCGCTAYAQQMDSWGVEKCREQRAEIVEHLRKAYKGTSYAELTKAIAKSVTSGLAFKLNPLDPLGSLVDEAIRRAEAV